MGVKLLINKFEKNYMEKYWKLQQCQWNNYFENGRYNLNEIDKELYDIVCYFNNKIQIIDRKSEIAVSLINRELVDKNPLVSKLRNRIDNFDNYNHDIDCSVKKNKYEYKYKIALAKNMKRDVIDLMRLRNKLAKELGYSSYPDLVLITEEINREKLVWLLNRYLDCNLLKAKNLIKKYNISWGNWFNDLDKIGMIDISYDPIELIDELLISLGFENIKNKIDIIFKEEGFNGFTSMVSPDDIRIVIEPINTLENIRTLFHEVGHAILYGLNNEKGLYRIMPPSYDESMAVVMEYISSKMLLDKQVQEKIKDIQILEYTRCAISALYEFKLWNNIDKSEELYIKYYSKLGFKIKDPEIWACDTFRSLDPVYIHNYVIGSFISENLIEYLNSSYSDNYRCWGRWLYEKIYRNGRKVSFNNKISINRFCM